MWDSLRLVDDYPEPGEKQMAAVLAPLYEDEKGQVRVVLTKRPDTMPTHAGHISFPAGPPHSIARGPPPTAPRAPPALVPTDPLRLYPHSYSPRPPSTPHTVPDNTHAPPAPTS